MTGPSVLLRDVFGFDAFRPGQADIVEAIAAGQNVLAIMPTGGGKSLCFQLPALMRDGVTVVISPLIALMRDQVRALQEAGVAAGALTSGNTPEETDAVFDALEAGRLKLLYMAPERLAAGSALGLLRRAGVSLIAVDEAHCVSQWGHDFRPDYLRIGALRRDLDVPLAAFTATADSETRAEIIESALKAGIEIVPEGVYGATQGPRLETAAEIRKLSADGCSIVGMTIMPEAALARELSLRYANCSIVVNWGAGIEDREITMEEIRSNLAAAHNRLRTLLANWLDHAMTIA